LYSPRKFVERKCQGLGENNNSHLIFKYPETTKSSRKIGKLTTDTYRQWLERNKESIQIQNMSKEAGNPAILNMHIIHTEKAKLP
jgi:hypothetical protein